jgi:hypothetical protein
LWKERVSGFSTDLTLPTFEEQSQQWSFFKPIDRVCEDLQQSCCSVLTGEDEVSAQQQQVGKTKSKAHTNAVRVFFILPSINIVLI